MCIRLTPLDTVCHNFSNPDRESKQRIMAHSNWRSVYFITWGLRILLAIGGSYIHPDEHFQSFEVLLSRFFGFSTNIPWEFSSVDPARSYVPLLVTYYPVLKVAELFQLLPIQSYFIARLALMVLSWIVIDMCLYKMLPTKQERIKAIYFTLTSYITHVYQSHTFSNSIETILVVLCVYMINELRFLLSTPSEKVRNTEIATLGLAIGACASFGIFNRVTFPAFLALPFFIYAKCALTWIWLPVLTLLSFVFTSCVCVVVDTLIYKRISLLILAQNPFNWSQYVLTPLNNLVYNSNYANLSQHGIHPYYTHILINLPQIMGPGLLFLFWRFKNRYYQTTPFLSAVGALIVLSFVPHQELRFLIPVVPLLCCCFDLTVFLETPGSTPVPVTLIMNSWLVFNLVLSLLMGIYHQGGVVPALSYFQERFYAKNETGVTQIWWRTYSPPTWLLGDMSNSTQYLDLANAFSPGSKPNTVIDAMGAEYEKVQSALGFAKSVNAQQRIFLVTPVASYKQFFNASLFNETWTYPAHLDLDHLDFSKAQSLQLGLGIYELL